MILRAVGTALLLLAVVGCAGDDEEAHPRATAATRTTTTTVATQPATGAERQWVEMAGEWALQFGSEFNPVPVAECEASFDEFVGRPPSKRVADVRALALDVCDAYGRLASAAQGSEERSQAAAAAGRAENALNERIFAYEFEASSSRPLPVRGVVSEESRIDPRLSRILSKLIGADAEARCWSPRDWKVVATKNPYGPGEVGGFVEAAGKVQLSPAVCKPLADYLYGGRDEQDEDLVWAVVVFAHEARHAAGEDVEARAECYAMQDAPRIARMLGISRSRAREIAETYWEEWYPDNEFPYSSDQCRNGGRLDLRPNSEVWP
ncbi:MAG: hypothetical protein ICV59_09805 [Thermoleophilia bacterium]|nr:hypothetical protein [Thermoleophilia bacterium]